MSDNMKPAGHLFDGEASLRAIYGYGANGGETSASGILRFRRDRFSVGADLSLRLKSFDISDLENRGAFFVNEAAALFFARSQRWGVDARAGAIHLPQPFPLRQDIVGGDVGGSLYLGGATVRFGAFGGSPLSQRWQGERDRPEFDGWLVGGRLEFGLNYSGLKIDTDLGYYHTSSAETEGGGSDVLGVRARVFTAPVRGDVLFETNFDDEHRFAATLIAPNFFSRHLSCSVTGRYETSPFYDRIIGLEAYQSGGGDIGCAILIKNFIISPQVIVNDEKMGMSVGFEIPYFSAFLFILGRNGLTTGGDLNLSLPIYTRGLSRLLFNSNAGIVYDGADILEDAGRWAASLGFDALFSGRLKIALDVTSSGALSSRRTMPRLYGALNVATLFGSNSKDSKRGIRTGRKSKRPKAPPQARAREIGKFIKALLKTDLNHSLHLVAPEAGELQEGYRQLDCASCHTYTNIFRETTFRREESERQVEVNQCGRCHDKGSPVDLTQDVLAKALTLRHERVNGGCADCHGRDINPPLGGDGAIIVDRYIGEKNWRRAHGLKVLAYGFSMDQCLPCHKGGVQGPNGIVPSCTDCHLEERHKAEPREPGMATFAHTGGSSCEVCHDPTGQKYLDELAKGVPTCNDCHRDTPPPNHTEGFRNGGHSVWAKVRPESCGQSSCHDRVIDRKETHAQCRGCHTGHASPDGLPVVSGIPHSGNFINYGADGSKPLHGQRANETKGRACVQCHADNFCRSCH